MRTIAIVGCGSQKRDLEDEQAVRIDQLYTSTYFQLKREYAQACCDDYYILSAKFGLVPTEALVAESYDLTVHDLDDDALAEWVACVDDRLTTVDADATLVGLAGQAYIDPLRDTLDDTPPDVFYPFADTGGIGEQMGWLKREIEATESDDLPWPEAAFEEPASDDRPAAPVEVKDDAMEQSDLGAWSQ